MVFRRSRQAINLARLLLLAAALVACGVNGDNVQQSSSTNTNTNTNNSPSPHLYSVEVDGKYGFIDEEGNLKFTLPEDVYTVGEFSE